MQNYLTTAPFNLADLHYLRVLGATASFTATARQLSVTPSALTRRIQSIEAKLGVPLFERTTRSVRVTEAGKFLLDQSSQIINDVGNLLQEFQNVHGTGPKQVRVGVSTTISLAHLPGLFSQNLRAIPSIQPTVAHHPSASLIELLNDRHLDAAILCHPRTLPRSLKAAHSFVDTFAIIAHEDLVLPESPAHTKRYRLWLETQPWMMLKGGSETAGLVQMWLGEQGITATARMELDSFDLMVHLVAMGMGVALVPIRAIAAFPRRHSIQRIPWPERFSRNLIVATRKDRNPPEYVKAFVDGILF